MKNSGIYCLLLAAISLGSCKDKTDQAADANATNSDLVVSNECYKAIYEKDTIDLELNMLKSGKVTGNMTMKVFNEHTNVGKIEGKYSGDTLFADYTFVDTTAAQKTFKNPLAFLKKDDMLILGKGEIQITMGISYLLKDRPIDFEKVKYKFSTVECKVK